MRIGWVSLAPTIDPATGGTLPSDVVERDGRLTSTLASVRLRTFIPMAALAARGHEVELLRVDAASLVACAARLATLDAVIFKKTLVRGRFVVELFERASAAGVPTLFDLCDLRVGEDSETGRRNARLLVAADRVVASTLPLADVAREMGARAVDVVTDPYEGARGEPWWAPRTDRLRVLWFGHPSNLDSLHGMLNELVVAGRRRPMQLTILTAHTPALLETCKTFNQRWRQVLTTRHEVWSPEGLGAALADCDVVVIPTLPGAPDKVVKSPNRMVESFWAGRCVVANPLPAYAPFGEWAFIDESIGAGLDRALAEEASIGARIRAAQGYIARVHSPEAIGEAWERAIGATIEAGRSRRVPAART